MIPKRSKRITFLFNPLFLSFFLLIIVLFISAGNPSFNNVLINTTNILTNNTNVNLSLSITNLDATGLYNVTNWYENNQSLLVLNMPFVTNTTDVKDYSGYNNNGTISGALWQRYLNEDNNSLVLMLPFDSDNSTTAIDFSEYRKNGVLNGGVALNTTNCVTGTCYTFDGINDNIVIPTSANIINNTFTLEAWIYPTTYSSWRNGIFHKEVYLTTGFRYGLESNGRLRFWTTQSGGDIEFFTKTIIPLNKWSHTVAIFAQGNISLYVNGILENSTTGSYANISSSSTISIGSGSYNYNGSIDNVRIYNKNLSASEIQDHYEKYKLYYSPSFKFDGVNDLINVGNGLSLNFTSINFTICLWSNQKGNTKDTQTMLNRGDGISATGSSYELLARNAANNYKLSVFQGSSNNACTDPDVHNLNQWYFVCGVRNAPTSKLYVNGVQKISCNYPGNLNDISTNVAVGMAGDGNDLEFNGSITQVMIFNRSLSSNQIYELYNSYNTSSLNKLVSEETTLSRTYKAQVYVANSSDLGSPLNTSELLILNDIPTSATLTEPENNRNFVGSSSSVTFRWTNGTDIVDNDLIRHIFQVSNDTSFSITNSFQILYLNTTSLTIGAGTYYWRIIEYDGFSNSTYSTSSFTINSIPTFTPLINSTLGTNRSNIDLNVYFTIADDETYFNYSIEVFRNNISNFSIPIIQIDVKFNQFIINNGNLTKNNTWKAQVRIYDGINYSIYQNTSELLILNSLPTAINIAYDKNEYSQRDNITLTFNLQDHDLDIMNDTITWYLNFISEKITNDTNKSNNDLINSSLLIGDIVDIGLIGDNDFYSAGDKIFARINITDQEEYNFIDTPLIEIQDLKFQQEIIYIILISLSILFMFFGYETGDPLFYFLSGVLLISIGFYLRNVGFPDLTNTFLLNSFEIIIFALGLYMIIISIMKYLEWGDM